ncbi:MAG: argininosuccinate lyase [Alphaproteobacteria bacterium]|nr:argininosuccinate lyase [Alphaproteobacteria bacterium]
MTKPSKQKTAPATNKMWGGHYTVGPADVMARINECIDIDARLYAEDIAASKAHAAMLTKCGILSAKDKRAIQRGLDSILKDIESGAFAFSAALEDIHMNVEARLADRIGDAAGRLHTARSRNDQVATDLRLWVRSAIDRLGAQLRELQKALVSQAEKHAATLMPGLTHLQPAQPITFGHHLLAYVEMFGRDRSRLHDARTRLNECPLGAAALAGTSFPIDRKMTAKTLGFDRPMANSLDAVADRDFALEFLSAASIVGIHLSRLAEEIVLWASDAFRFVALSEAFTTGSSIMPQKRNPDAAELVRAKAGTLIGALTQLLVLMKGLPLTYNKDLQDSKPPVIAAADQLEMMLAAMTGMVRDLTANKEAMARASSRGFLTATDLADWLVRELGLPFRRAHHVTGQIVRLAEEKACQLDELHLKDMQKIEPHLTAAIYPVLKPESAVASRRSLGGTAPERVRAEIKRWKNILGKK